MNNQTNTTDFATAEEGFALRDLLQSEVILIGGGELVADFH